MSDQRTSKQDKDWEQAFAEDFWQSDTLIQTQFKALKHTEVWCLDVQTSAGVGEGEKSAPAVFVCLSFVIL